LFEQKAGKIDWERDDVAARQARMKIYDFYPKSDTNAGMPATPEGLPSSPIERIRAEQRRLKADLERERMEQDDYMIALQRPGAMQAYAVLREAVENIRSFSEINTTARAQFNVRDNVHVAIRIDSDGPLLRVRLIQRESVDIGAGQSVPASIVIQEIRGVEFANRIFGREGGDFGEISVGRVELIHDPVVGDLYKMVTTITFRQEGE
jgi:hypothetical protein